MRLFYAPKGGEKRTWSPDPDDNELTLSEIGDLEKCAGMGFLAFRREMADGHWGALRPLLYVLLKREEPGLKYADFNPKISEIGEEYDRAELEDLRAKILANPDLPDRDETLLAIDAQLAAMPADAEPGPGKGRGSASGGTSRPTARSPRSGKSTRSRSK